MPINQRTVASFVAILLGVWLGADVSIGNAADSEPLQAGTAVVEITPPLGYRMSGYFNERLNTGTKDALLAKAVVFRQGSRQAALVFCDIVGISLNVSQQVRRHAEQQTGIPAEHIAICATHSHTGPLYFGALRQHFHDKAVAAHGTDSHEKVDYPAQLIDNLVTVIKQAQAAVSPVELTAGNATENRLSFNRRFLLSDGSVRFNPGQLNPAIVRPVGPIDSEVGIIAFKSVEARSPSAALVSFALHLDTVGGTEYSADYPKYLQDRLQESYGKDFLSMFGAGTCGDINHVDVKVRGRRSASEIGTMLGETVAEQMPQLAPVKRPALAVRRAVVNVPLQKYDDKQIAAAKAKMEFVADRKVPFIERVEAYKIMALQLRDGDDLPIEVQVFRLSEDVAIVTLPGEVFVNFGLAIKEASPFKTTLVIELTNDAPGYIPTKQAFDEGHYEPTNSRIQPGGGERMVESTIRLLKAAK